MRNAIAAAHRGRDHRVLVIRSAAREIGRRRPRRLRPPLRARRRAPRPPRRPRRPWRLPRRPRRLPRLPVPCCRHGITELAQVFKPLTVGWRPTGTTLVVARAMVSGDITLVAVPLGPRGAAGAPIPIVSFVPDRWALRPDGGALAVSVWTGRGTRIAIWDMRSGAGRWLTPDEPAQVFCPHCGRWMARRSTTCRPTTS